jgi:chorismate mutase
MIVPGPNPRSVARCIRVLLLYNTERGQNEMRSAYLRGAAAIKADLDRTRQEISQ